MKKYKLIKKYPGFSELGTIIECQDGTSYYSKNPEYWEEVLAPDYEILVRKLVNENSLIHSVKRLSDGEVFTIGDMVSREDGLFKGTLISINDKLEAKTSSEDCIGMNWLIKLSPILYRTHDGVDIHLGDETWGLHKNSFYLSPKPTKNNNPNWVQVGEPAHWVFSTEEAAKEYQLRYAPCLSLDDIRRAIYLSATSLERLLATAKSKL